MSNLLIGFYGLYLLMTAYKGDSQKVMGFVQEDAPKFLPWAIAIVVLSLLYNNDKTHKIVEPFIFLAILTFVLKNFKVISAEVSKIYHSASGTTPPLPNTTQTVA